MADKKTKTKAPTKKPEESIIAKKLAAQVAIMKKYGATTGMASGGCTLGEVADVGYYPTGLPVFDSNVIGIGGLPKGCVVEVYGIKSSGKSALAMFLAAMVQKKDPLAFVKLYYLEGKVVPKWYLDMGLDPRRTLIPETKGSENMANQIHADLASENPPEIIIIDSIAVTTPESVKEKSIEDRTMRDNLARASFLTDFFNSLTDGFYFPPKQKKPPKNAPPQKHVKLKNTPTCILCINHAKTRTKVIAPGKSITEWYSVGGVSLDFAAVLQFMVKRIGFEKTSNGEVTHQKIKITADKNKLAPPKKSCEVLLNFKGGMEQIGVVDYLGVAIEKGLASAAGAWITCALLPDGKIQGRDKFNQFVDEHPDVKKVFAE